MKNANDFQIVKFSVKVLIGFCSVFPNFSLVLLIKVLLVTVLVKSMYSILQTIYDKTFRRKFRVFKGQIFAAVEIRDNLEKSL